MERIKKIPMFSALSQRHIQKLQEISTIKSYEPKEILFYEGDNPEYMHVLLKGGLKLYKTNHKSQQIFLHQFNNLNLIAELANFENIPYPATAEFTTKAEVLKIDYKKLEEGFFQNPEISSMIIKSLAGKLKILINVVQNEVVLTSEAKVAKFLLRNAELFGTLKNTQIASILNITPETLSRTLTKLKSSKIIETPDKNSVIILNEEKLKQLVE
ncbi:MAG: Crp/Fnr family transcriptional regulator [Sulfurospirillaceae bacterium]|nr:Crp/Fnr family transcriptional regulator [Sulfurospirillaceae bacterium]